MYFLFLVRSPDGYMFYYLHRQILIVRDILSHFEGTKVRRLFLESVKFHVFL